MSRAVRSHPTGPETEAPRGVLTNTDSPSQPRPQSLGLSVALQPLPVLGIVHTQANRKLHTNASVKAWIRGHRTCWPTEELHSEAMISQQRATMTELDLLWWRSGAISSRIPSLTRMNWELKKERQINAGLLTCIVTLVDLLFWTVWSYIVWRMCRQDRQQRQSWLRRRGFHQGFQRQHAVELHQLILYSNCTCTNMPVGYFHSRCALLILPRTKIFTSILNVSYKQSGRLHLLEFLHLKL